VKPVNPVSSARGFTLLEVLVAMAIVGLGVVTLLELFSLGLRLGARSTVQTEAVTYARQVMDEFLVRWELRDGSEQGSSESQNRWKLQVRTADQTTGDRSLASDWELKEVTLDMVVSDGGRDKSVEFRTLRLVRKKQP